MNKERRAELDRAKTMIEGAQSIIEQAMSEEQEYYDNMAENFQNGDKGESTLHRSDQWN